LLRRDLPAMLTNDTADWLIPAESVLAPHLYWPFVGLVLLPAPTPAGLAQAV
jgi:hypothetical protein